MIAPLSEGDVRIDGNGGNSGLGWPNYDVTDGLGVKYTARQPLAAVPQNFTLLGLPLLRC